MKQYEDYSKINSIQYHISIRGEYPYLLFLNTTELKYIVPWAQYDENIEENINYITPNVDSNLMAYKQLSIR